MLRKYGVFILLYLSFWQDSFAYDDKSTHPLITDFAVQKYTKTSKYLSNNLGIDFSSESKSLINGRPIINWAIKGSTEEDSPSCRAASHFLNPRLPWNEAGLSDTNETLFGFGLNTLCFGSAPFSSRFSIHKYSDVTWATRYTSPTEQGGETGNDMDWTAARTYYRLALTATDQYSRETYFAKTFQTLGQVMHLLQDMAVPAHVRNDFTAQRLLEELS